jgi:hypothetical protein
MKHLRLLVATVAAISGEPDLVAPLKTRAIEIVTRRPAVRRKPWTRPAPVAARRRARRWLRPAKSSRLNAFSERLARLLILHRAQLVIRRENKCRLTRPVP